ncbi:MAG: hypothetical protein QOD53_1581, partial [Thermoleophilaceae bacterium]|nr:hypothetical protein [Thermoleophilaceae bacterium]
MKHRSRLAWLGALALILALPPVASSVVGDLGAASQSSERRQNGRLDRHGLRLSKHGRQITRLKAAEYGVARGLITTASGSVYLMTLTTPKIPTDGNQAMASGSVPFASAGGEQLTLRGVVRSNRPSGTGRAAGMLTVVCAPMGTGTCAGGTVGAGETVCKI